MRRVALLLIVLFLAGCAQPGDSLDEVDEVGWEMLALPFGEGHDHRNPLHHLNGTTPNFKPLGHDAMVSDFFGMTAGGYLCGDAAWTEDGRRIAAVESRSDVGFALVDVTDPLQPRWIGELVMASTYIYDLVVVPDGKHVVLVTRDAQLPVPAPAPSLTFRTACGDHTITSILGEDNLPREQAILLVDISDPTEPTIVDHQRLPGYGHSAFSIREDGRLLVMAVTLGPDLRSSWVQLYEVQDLMATTRLQLLSSYKAAETTDLDGMQNNVWHDGWIQRHPVSGGLLMHIVGQHNYHILNIDDPTMPQVVGTWSDDAPGAGHYTGNLHSAYPLPDLWNGRHYTIIGPEWGQKPEDHPTGIVRILDTTDPARPFEAGAWTLPVDVTWDEGAWYQYSNHYLAVHNMTMFISMYHGGIWAVDLEPLGTAEWVNLPTLGSYQPLVLDVGVEDVATWVRWAPTTEEVFAFDDGLITFDSNTGLHTFTFDKSIHVPVPEPWPLSPLGVD